MSAVNLLMNKYMLRAALVFSAFFVLSAPASAQYLRDFSADEPADSAAPSAPVYSPYMGGQQQVAPAQQNDDNDAIYEQLNIGNTLMKSFAEDAARGGTDRNALDPAAPSLRELSSIQAIPDDPVQYCGEYDKNNPSTFFSKTASENFISERIKPVGQMNFNLTKSCLNKVKEIAEQMLVDYSAYKRNDLLLRAQQNPEKADMMSRKANELSKANLYYSNSTRAECALARRDNAANAFELNDMVEACMIQMLKKRIKYIASM
jgi:hypothetical protein